MVEIIRPNKENFNKNLLEKYNASKIIKITDNIYWTRDKEFWNINNFINNKWELLFNAVGVIKDLWVNKYKELLNKLWYKWYVDEKDYYHMLDLKTWKEIPQESLKYYEIFDTLCFISNREDIYEDWQDWVKDFKLFMKNGKQVYKQIADILEDADKKYNYLLTKVRTAWISPLEFFSYLSLWLIEKADILKYTKAIFNIEYLEKYYNHKWWELLENKKFKILLWEWKASYDGERILFEKYKAYEISLKPSEKNIDLILEKVLPFVEKLELDNAKNKQEQEEIKLRYEQVRDFFQKEKQKLEHIKATKEEVSGLEKEVKKR